MELLQYFINVGACKRRADEVAGFETDISGLCSKSAKYCSSLMVQAVKDSVLT